MKSLQIQSCRLYHSCYVESELTLALNSESVFFILRHQFSLLGYPMASAVTIVDLQNTVIHSLQTKMRNIKEIGWNKFGWVGRPIDFLPENVQWPTENFMSIQDSCNLHLSGVTSLYFKVCPPVKLFLLHFISLVWNLTFVWKRRKLKMLTPTYKPICEPIGQWKTVEAIRRVRPHKLIKCAVVMWATGRNWCSLMAITDHKL